MFNALRSMLRVQCFAFKASRPMLRVQSFAFKASRSMLRVQSFAFKASRRIVQMFYCSTVQDVRYKMYDVRCTIVDVRFTIFAYSSSPFRSLAVSLPRFVAPSLCRSLALSLPRIVSSKLPCQTLNNRMIYMKFIQPFLKVGELGTLYQRYAGTKAFGMFASGYG